ncbi:MAG: hypothetical protein ACR2F1_03310 [Nitrososphaeraceae archaeon]
MRIRFLLSDQNVESNHAKINGAILSEVNPEPIVFNEIIDYSIRGITTEILIQLLQL